MLGIMSVDEPISGLRPSDDDLAVLAALAAHAAQAVQDTLAAAEAARHRTALEQLLRVSARLTQTMSIDAILAGGLRRHPRRAGLQQRLGRAHRPRRPARRAARGRGLDDRGGRGLAERRPRDAAAAARPRVRGRGLLPAPQLRGVRAAGHRAPRLRVGAQRQRPAGLGPPLARHPAARPRGRAGRRHLGRRARGPAHPVDRPPAGAADVRQPGRHGGRGGWRPSRRCSSSRRTTRSRAWATAAPSPGAWPRRSTAPARYGQRFALVVLDVDGFKALNDRYGHFEGDLALEAIGEVLRATLRRSDSAFRLGGDEFALILEDAGVQEATERRRSHRRRHRRRPGRRRPPAARIVRRRDRRRDARSRGAPAGRRRGHVRGQARRRRRALRGGHAPL